MNNRRRLLPPLSVILAALLLLLVSFASAQQPPTLTLLNGDIDGDNEVTLFDFGALTDAFGSMPGDPNWNPDADLDGDDEVSLLDFGILTSQFGQVGAEEFAGTAQAASGAFTATVRVELGDWSAQTERVVYVVLQFKRTGTEQDSGTPIFEQVVSFAQNETVKEVQVRLPAGNYTLRALAYNDAQRSDISHWLRSELSGIVVPQGGGVALPDIPPPAWAEEVVPTDTVSTGGLGPSSADHVNLASGVFEHRPPADIVVYNPVGPSVSFSRTYRSKLAQEGYFSPGLSPGWVHNYDITISGTAGSWGTLTLRYPNGATEQLTPVLDSNGNVRSYRYEGGITTVTVYNADGSVAHTWSQKIGNLNVDAGMRDAAGHESSVVYNGYRPVQVTNRNGQSTTLEYDQFFNLTRVTPPRVPAVQYDYDTSQFALGRLVRVWQGSKTPTEFVYYPNGLLRKVRVPRPGTSGSGEQVEIEYVYTSLGNLLEVRAPSPNPAQGVRTTRCFYLRDPFTGYEEPERLNCPLAVAVYDGVFNPSDVNDRLLYRVSFRYDTLGRVTQVIDGLGSTTRITYNAAGQVDTVTYPADSSLVQRKEEYKYSAVGGQLLKKQVWNLSSSSLEQEINLQAGKEGELIGQSGGVQTAGYVRDALYRARGVVDGRGNGVQFGYDPRGFLQSKLYPLGDTYTFSTDNEGNLTQRTDPDGVVVEYVRDPVDSRIQQVNYPGMNMDVLVSYDSYNRVVGLSNGVATISYTYDDGDRLLSETVEYADMPGVSFTVTYQYYPDGSLQSITAPYRLEQQGGQYVAASGLYQYDYQFYPYQVPGFGFGPGEAVTVTTPWASSISTYFDRRGLPRRQDVIDGNSQLTTMMSYNPRGLLSSLMNRYNSITVSNFSGIRYDSAGNRVEIGSLRIEPIIFDPEQPSLRARGMYGKMTYTMNATRRQLLEETFSPLGYDIPTYSLPFAYDPSDNLTSGRGFSFGYNANNQITNSGFGYDVNGNATLFNNVGHIYDYENRVLEAGFIQAEYRPDGRRAWKQPGDRSTRTYYLYDGGRVILEFNPTNGFYQAYAYGANGLACSERQDGHMVYAFDPAGNLVHRFRNGTVLSNSWFDSYGGLLYDDSATGVKPYPSPDSVGYQGQWGAYTDVESRAYAQYLRWVFVDGDYYHPLTGTFLTRRSAGTNEYSAGVNPVDSWTDVVQDILDLVGVVDPTGVVDVVNAAGYALRGKWGSAGMTILGVIPYAGDTAKFGRLIRHHIATNKNWIRHPQWSRDFQRLFARGGMTLEEAANIVELPAELHKGPHSQAYHQWVYDELSRAIQGLRKKEEIRAALEARLRWIAEQLQAHPEYLRNPPIPGGQ